MEQFYFLKLTVVFVCYYFQPSYFIMEANTIDYPSFNGNPIFWNFKFSSCVEYYNICRTWIINSSLYLKCHFRLKMNFVLKTWLRYWFCFLSRFRFGFLFKCSFHMWFDFWFCYGFRLQFGFGCWLILFRCMILFLINFLTKNKKYVRFTFEIRFRSVDFWFVLWLRFWFRFFRFQLLTEIPNRIRFRIEIDILIFVSDENETNRIVSFWLRLTFWFTFR